jgi:hypothetical protein
MSKSYNNLEIPEEVTAALAEEFESGSVTTMSQDEPTEAVEAEVAETTTEESSKEVNEPVVEDKFDGLEISGERFDRDTILSWREDSANKNEWQKSNTEKAQSISKWSKLSEKIDSDESFRTHLKDYFYDNPEAIKQLGLDGTVGVIDEAEVPEIPSELESRLNILEEIEGDRVVEKRIDVLDSTLSKLEKEYPEYLADEAKVSEFLEFTDSNVEKFLEEGTPNLERAFREWSYNQMQEELTHYKQLENNSKRNDGKIIDNSELGAKEVKTPAKINSYKDFNMDNPLVQKYFK